MTAPGWVREARGLNAENGPAAIGDQRIGHVLSGAPVDPDGAWPHATVHDILERVESVDIERGIEVGVYGHSFTLMTGR